MQVSICAEDKRNFPKHQCAATGQLNKKDLLTHLERLRLSFHLAWQKYQIRRPATTMTIPATISPTRREVTSTGPGLSCSVDHEPIIKPRYCLHYNPKNLLMILNPMNTFDLFKFMLYVNASTQNSHFYFLLSRAINKFVRKWKREEILSIDRGVITHFCCIHTWNLRSLTKKWISGSWIVGKTG